MALEYGNGRNHLSVSVEITCVHIFIVFWLIYSFWTSANKIYKSLLTQNTYNIEFANGPICFFPPAFVSVGLCSYSFQILICICQNCRDVGASRFFCANLCDAIKQHCAFFNTYYLRFSAYSTTSWWEAYRGIILPGLYWPKLVVFHWGKQISCSNFQYNLVLSDPRYLEHWKSEGILKIHSSNFRQGIDGYPVSLDGVYFYFKLF